jgi:outer membrane protein insertion porin family
VVEPERVRQALGVEDVGAIELSDSELRGLARELGARAVITGSLTELAGRYSIDVRLTPASPGAQGHTIVFTAGGEEALEDRIAEAAERLSARLSEAGPGQVLAVSVEGAGELEPELRGMLRTREGELFDPLLAREDEVLLEAHPQVASVSLESERSSGGVVLLYRVVRAEMIFGSTSPATAGERVLEVRIQGNRRIDSEAIRSRIKTRPGEVLRPAQLAGDVNGVFALGFFRNVRVLSEDTPDGRILIFEVEENPVVRQIAIIGNDNIDSDDVREALTLTTGSTLDYPLLHENTQRIEQLYRAQGYFLAEVSYEIQEIAEGSVTINFDVVENEKLRLREILFIGNEHFSSAELMEDFATRRWRFWSTITSWFDKSGTYSEPVFYRDLRAVEKKYTDAGFLQAEIGKPEVEPAEDGLLVSVKIGEGPQFQVGEIEVVGDESVDLESLREKLKLETGEVFNRSSLTEDVESLERFYTDRGFYFASVQPGTRLSQEEKIVDVEFRVEKGPLYFIRHIDISGNTQTVDRVIRREMKAVEGQLYSARSIQVSNRRVRRLGFFEDATFEPKPTDDPAQLDLEVGVVERPTGSFSFGAGFSSQDRFVFTASLSQSNLFGRGYAANLSADIGGRTSRFFFSVSDPYFLGSSFSLGTTLFMTSVRFQDFEQDQQGFDVVLGHALNEDNTARGFTRYSFASRRIEQNTGVNAAAVIFRELLQGNESSSLIGLSMRADTRDDPFAPISGRRYGASVEFAGLGGFARYLRLEASQSWYLGAPSWMLDRSTFVIANRVGYVIPFNSISDYEFQLGEVPGCDAEGACDGVARLDQIDRDLKLPLTERYFLGGIGSFQLRGFRGRSVGPRRAILKRSGLFGEGDLFLPVGRQVVSNPEDSSLATICADRFDPSGLTLNNQGDGDGKCNDIDDRDLGDFEDLDETDVVGGNKFITSSLEYRFPISEEVGLQGVFFADGGNTYAEGDHMFDPTDWRYGVGGGVLWFSPFGPLQLVLGFPMDRNPEIEKSPIFEFSVGGLGL